MQESKALARARRQSLARVTATTGFVSAIVTAGLMSLIALLMGGISIHVGFFYLFFVVVSTAAGYWFGKIGGRLVKPRQNDDG